MTTVPTNIRTELTKRARDPSKRVLDKISKWCHGEVVDPESGSAFTKAGSWEFVAKLIEEGHDLDSMILSKYSHKGKTAYTMVVKMGKDRPRLYIKVRLGYDNIIGLSFHYNVHDLEDMSDERKAH